MKRQAIPGLKPTSKDKVEECASKTKENLSSSIGLLRVGEVVKWELSVERL